MKATTCRLCGQEIFMIKMVNRKTIPVDTEPVWVHPDSSAARRASIRRKNASTTSFFFASNSGCASTSSARYRS